MSIEYERCDLCRKSHSKGKGHVYSKAHKTVLQNMITKFAKKVSLARRCLKSPRVFGANWEPGACRWCYFCEEEVERHGRDAGATTQDTRLLQHLASERHKKSTLTFWRKQHLEKEKHVFFLVDEEKLKKHEDRCSEAVTAYLEEQEIALKAAALRMTQQDAMRTRLVTHHRQHVMSQIAQTATSHQRMLEDQSGDQRPIVRTVAAKAEGLTVVNPRAYNKAVGNIYSGALPPWLQPGSPRDGPSAATIGPTQTDFTKHLENERKQKLPKTRVGARFDHKSVTDSAWLPSFGRVWSNQCRTHAQKQFGRSLRGSRSRGRGSHADAQSHRHMSAAQARHHTSATDTHHHTSNTQTRHPASVMEAHHHAAATQTNTHSDTDHPVPYVGPGTSYQRLVHQPRDPASSTRSAPYLKPNEDIEPRITPADGFSTHTASTRLSDTLRSETESSVCGAKSSGLYYGLSHCDSYNNGTVKQKLNGSSMGCSPWGVNDRGGVEYTRAGGSMGQVQGKTGVINYKNSGHASAAMGAAPTLQHRHHPSASYPSASPYHPNSPAHPWISAPTGQYPFTSAVATKPTAIRKIARIKIASSLLDVNKIS